MKITTEPLEDRQLLLTIEVDEERTRQAMRRAARQIAKQVSIPGFRKGKAPYQVIVQRYGEDTVRKEAADLLANEVYREAMEQEGIEAYAAGVLEDLTFDPITFKLTVPLKPTVDLGDYRNYRLKPPEVGVDKEDVQRVLEEIRERNAILEPVGRPAALDDIVTVDVVGRTAEGAEFLREGDFQVLLNPETSEPLPGFSEAVVGMEVNEERTFILTLPTGFPREELRGEEAEFTVTLKKLYERILPKLDDDLARTAGNFDSLEQLQEQVEEQLRKAAQGKADQEYAEQVLEAIIEQAQVAYPPVMIKEELDKMVAEVERGLRREAHLSMEDYLRTQGKSPEELREELKPSAAARLKRALVLGEVVQQEGLKVDEGEISAHIEEVSAPWGVRADEVRASLASGEGRQVVHSRLLASRAVQRLMAIAKGEADEAQAAQEEQEREQETVEQGGEGAEGQESRETEGED